MIDNEEGKRHVVKRADRPAIRLIPEWFGSGKLPRRELHEVAQALDSGEAALMVIGEPTLQKGFEQAVTRAANTVRRDLHATTDELAEDLIEASSRAQARARALRPERESSAQSTSQQGSTRV